MQGSAGSGNIMENPGVVQLAAKDIFDAIDKNQDRTYLVRVR